MTRHTVRSLLVCLSPALALLLGGCGPSAARTVEVKGNLVLPPNLKLAETDTIAITFLADGDAKAQGGNASMTGKDRSFTAQVPTGKYKIAVEIQAYAGEKGADDRNRQYSQAVGKFNSGATSLLYEVTDAEQQSITIDLAKETVTKN